jgi:tRNA nucleotidyltransferase/poly(A) polymerase
LYGKGAPDKKALSACSKFSSKIKTLSRERITQEFTKILMGNNPQKILSLMQEHKIIPEIIGESFNPERIGSLIKNQKILGQLDKDIIFSLRLLIVLGFQFKKITKISNLLIINKKQNLILNDIAKTKIDTKRFNKLKIMELLYFYPSNSVLAALILMALKENLSASEFKKIAILFNNTIRPVFSISGKDLLKQGIPEGIELGKTLAQLEKKWIKSGFTLSRKDLLN